MTPYAFGRKIAAELGIQPVPKVIPDIPKAPKAPTGAAPTGPKPPKPTMFQNAMQTGGNMLSNSGRVGGGMLSTVAGGLGTAGTGLAAGATNAWNAVTPKSMNTSPEFSGAVNNAFNKSVEFTNAGARDVYDGTVGTAFNGDTNYGQQKSWDVMQQGLNDKTVDPVSRGVATGAAYAGHGAWNLAQAVPAATAALPAAQGAMQFGRQLATTGKNLVTSGYNAVTAPARFVQNTFKPGFGTIRNSLRNTARVYNQPPVNAGDVHTIYRAGVPSNSRGAVFARQGTRDIRGAKELQNASEVAAGGQYVKRPFLNDVATSLNPRGTAEGMTTMRHELAHGVQANTAQANSLQGLTQSWMNSPGNWRQAAGRMLAEVNSNAAEARGIPQQISKGLNFLTDPAQAQFYSNYYKNTPFGSQYAMLHNGAVLAPHAGKYVGAAGAAGAGGAYGANAVSDFMQPE